MRNYIFTIMFATFLWLLITPATVWAEVNTVQLSSIAPNSSLHSKASQISPASLATMMKLMRFKKEMLFGEIFSSGESKIDGLFSSGKTIEVFSSAEIQVLSIEISDAANMLEAQQGIAFKSEMGRIKGYVFFSGQQSIWYLASIEGRPAHQTKIIEDESYMLDDPEADSRWSNKVEKSYWQLKPQQGQSLHQDRPDWLRVPVKHIAAIQAKKVVRPQQAVPPVVVHKTSPVEVAPAIVDTTRELRIERLQRLLSKELISSAEYDGKMVSIITEFNQSHPAIEDQIEFLKRLRDENKISQEIYQPRRQELLEKL